MVSCDPFFKSQQPRNRLKSAMDSIASTDQHKILFAVVPDTIVFAREKNSPLITRSPEAFEGQLPKNRQKTAIGSIANINQHKVLFPLMSDLIGFVNKNFSLMKSWSHD